MRPTATDDDTQAPEPMAYVHASASEVAAALAEDAADVDNADDADSEIGGFPQGWESQRRELDDGTPISRTLLVKLPIRTKIRHVVHGPDGELLRFGRTRRFFTKAQREAVAVRDRECACGCGLDARLCDIDHRIEWRDRGSTHLDNAQPLSWPSHREKTHQHNRQR